MTAELFWLTLTAMMTSMFWLPYMIDRVNVRGVMGAFGNPGPDALMQSSWAERAYSGVIRPPVPIVSGHPYRFDPAGDSGASGHPHFDTV